MSSTLQLRIASLLEGASLLLLLFIAMPLKYAFEMPMAVRIVGGLHGLLFVGLVLSALRAYLEGTCTKGVLARMIGLSLVPFGFLVAERRLRVN